MKFTVFSTLFTLGILLWGCSSENVSGGNETFDGNVIGVTQKGPFLEGSSVTMQELDGKSLAQTGKSFKGKVVNDRGDFSIENVALDHPYVLLEVNGYYRNEVTGKKSNGSIFMKALADVSKQPKVNINLLTHLEYERVQTLMEQNNMSIEEAKRQADREIFAAFYADVDYDKVEHLSIFGNGEGDAALLAINVLLLGEESEADFMERFVTVGQDLAADGVWNDSLLRIKIADFACQASISGKLAKIRKNIESWKIANVPAFETYVNRFWTNQYGLGKCDASNLGMRKLFVDDSRSSVFQESVFKCSENGWIPDSMKVHIDGGIYSFPACNAEREGTVQKLFIGNPKYGSKRSFKCEQGSWNEVEAGGIDDACAKSDVKIGDVCPVEYLGYVSMGGPIRLSCYVYTENGWTKKGADDFYDENQKSSCEEVLNAPKIETECTDGERAEKTIDDKVYHYTCSSGEWQVTDVELPVITVPLEESVCPAEGVYETVLDTLAVYDNGNVMEWTSYYHCESGAWVKTDCRDPLDACTADNEGEMKNVVCSQQPGNPKAAKTEWDFVCKDKKWEKMSAEESKTARINAQCTTADTKIGDVCSIISGGNVSFGIMPTTLNCYVYTEEGWVSKANGGTSTTCEELLNASADSTAAED